MSDREGRDTDRQVRGKLLLGWQTDAGLAPRHLPVRRVRETARHHQEDRRSRGGREGLGTIVRRRPKGHLGQAGGIRKNL